MGLDRKTQGESLLRESQKVREQMTYFEKVEFPVVEETTYYITDDRHQTVALSVEQARELLNWLEQYRDELRGVVPVQELFPPEELPAQW